MHFRQNDDGLLNKKNLSPSFIRKNFLRLKASNILLFGCTFYVKNKHTYFLSLGKSFKNRNFWMVDFFCVWARFENHCQRLTFDVLQPLWPKSDLFCEWDFNNIWLYSLFQKNVSYSIMKSGTTAAYQDNIETLPVL